MNKLCSLTTLTMSPNKEINNNNTAPVRASFNSLGVSVKWQMNAYLVFIEMGIVEVVVGVFEVILVHSKCLSRTGKAKEQLGALKRAETDGDVKQDNWLSVTMSQRQQDLQ